MIIKIKILYNKKYLLNKSSLLLNFKEIKIIFPLWFFNYKVLLTLKFNCLFLFKCSLKK